MNNEIMECKVESFKNDPLPESKIKVEVKFYDGTGGEFLIEVKNKNNCIFYSIAKMFANYFACLKLHPLRSNPPLSENTIEELKPLAIAFFRELCKQDLKDESHGAELLELWTNQASQLLQSGHGIH